ncbi:MAG: hypothetical protein ACI8PZ_006920 [Myxococcota bacterium]|jgi:hypothetical protein
MSETGRETFWRLAEAQIAGGRAERGTMMGSQCVRVQGQFAGMVHSKTGEVILKLPAARVLALIADDVAEPFRPNGKLFKEWALLPAPDADMVGALLDEAITFAGSKS